MHMAVLIFQENTPKIEILLFTHSMRIKYIHGTLHLAPCTPRCFQNKSLMTPSSISSDSINTRMGKSERNRTKKNPKYR
ncbi:hypothetical protein VNO77_32892 [Canavalia gladiata]|uniref:Uncharacterized protein n=1 Tax=Canavalia gladiata TaxID=3824 RepID=A0AAN9PXV8_CANGL